MITVFALTEMDGEENVVPAPATVSVCQLSVPY